MKFQNQSIRQQPIRSFTSRPMTRQTRCAQHTDQAAVNECANLRLYPPAGGAPTQRCRPERCPPARCRPERAPTCSSSHLKAVPTSRQPTCAVPT